MRISAVTFLDSRSDVTYKCEERCRAKDQIIAGFTALR